MKQEELLYLQIYYQKEEYVIQLFYGCLYLADPLVCLQVHCIGNLSYFITIQLAISTTLLIYLIGMTVLDGNQRLCFVCACVRACMRVCVRVCVRKQVLKTLKITCTLRNQDSQHKLKLLNYFSNTNNILESLKCHQTGALQLTVSKEITKHIDRVCAYEVRTSEIFSLA